MRTEQEILNDIKTTESVIADLQKQIDTPMSADEMQLAKYNAASEAVMSVDPDMGKRFSDSAINMTNKIKDNELKRDLADAKSIADKDPEKARVKLIQILDNYIEMRNSGLDKNQDVTTIDAQIGRIEEEISKLDPNIRNAFTVDDDKNTNKDKQSDTEDSADVVESYDTRLADINAVKSQADAKALKDKFISDPLNGLTNKQSDNLDSSIDNKISQLRDRSGEIKGKQKDYAIKYQTDYLKTFKPKLISDLNSIKANIISQKRAFNTGNMAAINLAPVKETMGALSTGEYGIAGDNKFASVLGNMGGLFAGIANAIMTEKFNSKLSAASALDKLIDDYNTAVTGTKEKLSIDNVTKGTGDEVPDNIWNDALKTNATINAIKGSLNNIPRISDKEKEAVGITLNKTTTESVDDFSNF